MRIAPVWCTAVSTLCALILLGACGGPESQSASTSAAGEAATCVSPQGGPCGGNIQGACTCEPGLTCTGTSGLPVGDVGGTCQPATCATTACGPGQRCCEVPDATGVCAARCVSGRVCPALPCRAPPPRCIQTQLCVQGDHWDSNACRCVPNAPGACTTAADCQGVLPALCLQCPGGGSACAHWACVDGQCQTAYCP